MPEQVYIRMAVLDDIPVIRSMADIVFRDTYRDILSPEQMEYMMDWMYGAGSLEDQITGDGRSFFVAEVSGSPCGYASLELEDREEDGRRVVHLQKLYVLPDMQRKGVGTALFNFLADYVGGFVDYPARIALNVNRHNGAVRFYEKMGMTRQRSGDFPIGHGYYMNDYIYILDI